MNIINEMYVLLKKTRKENLPFVEPPKNFENIDVDAPLFPSI